MISLYCAESFYFSVDNFVWDKVFILLPLFYFLNIQEIYKDHITGT